MRRKLALLSFVLVAAGCSTNAAVPTASHPTATASPVEVSPVSGFGEASPSPISADSPTPSSIASPTVAPAYGVLVDLSSFPDQYNVNVVAADGTIKAALRQGRRKPITTPAGHAIELPYVSTSLNALYFLDGDSTLRSFSLADGSQRTVMQLPVNGGQEAAFAVSPDDSRIAFSILDFNVSPVRVTIYTESLAGADRRPIFTSTTDFVWPVAWHAGLLVLAHAYGPYAEDVVKAAPDVDNPYSAISYHVVDPATANRVVLIGACTVSGPLSPAGSGCIQGGTIDWAGNTTDWSTNDWGTRSAAAAVSPDGQWVAATDPNIPQHMAIWRRSDGLIANYTSSPGLTDWAGWLDSETLIIGSYRDGTWTPTVENVIQGGPVHSIAARGFYAARLPTDIV